MPPQGSQLPSICHTSNLRAEWATILIYAPARWGKTDLVRGCVEAGMKPLIFATEIGQTRGLLTLTDLDVPVIFVPDWDTSVLILAEMRKTGVAQYQNTMFDILFVDSITGTGEDWMDKAKTTLGWDMVHDGQPGEKKDARRAYLYTAEKGRQGMKQFFDTPAHLVFLAREGIMEETTGWDEKGHEIKIQYSVPELPGAKLPKELPGWPDATLHGTIRGRERVFETTNHGKTVSGIRLPGSVARTKLPDYIKPNIPAIIKLMQGDASAISQLLTDTDRAKQEKDNASKASGSTSPSPAVAGTRG